MQYIGEMWVGRRRAEWARCDVAYTIFASESGPSPAQLDLLQEILSQNDEFLSQLKTFLHRYFQAQVRAHEGPVATDDVWGMIDELGVVIPASQQLMPGEFLLSMECDWDPEHGLHILYKNMAPVDAGQHGEFGSFF